MSPVPESMSRRHPRGRRWHVQVVVALVLVGALLAMRRELPASAAPARLAARIVDTWTWPRRSALAAAARFIGRRSWGTLLDVWSEQVPGGAVPPVPDGHVAVRYGWQPAAGGFRFEPGVRVQGPVGGPVLASAVGTVARSGPTVWVVVSPAIRVGYVGLSRVAVRAGSRVARGTVLGQSPGAITVVVWEHGYPVNPQDTPYLGVPGRR